MKIFNYMSIIGFALFFCCKTENLNDNAAQANSDDQTVEITAKAIEAFRFDDYQLSSDAQKVITNWSKYQELSTQISFLRQADITFFTREKDTLKVFLQDMRSTIPDTIATNPIQSRLSVLDNTLLKLNNDLQLDNYAVENKLSSIKALLIANSDLIYFINKKIEFDKKDVERPTFANDSIAVDSLIIDN